MDIHELQHYIDMLYHAGGQAGMEYALALWYLKKASSASNQNAACDALKKAQALDPENSHLWLAQYYRCKNNFDEASQHYLKAFVCNPNNRSHWPMIGEFLLRYGTSDEVVDFYTNLAAIDPGNDAARFILDCYTYFESLKQEIGTKIVCARQNGQNTHPFLMQVVFWGPRYTDIFLNYLLPALCAPGNIPCLAQNHEIHFVICTDKNGAEELQRHSSFEKIKKYCCSHIITFSERLFEYATNISKRHGGKWTIPVTLLTNAAHYAVLECGRQLNSYVLNFSPDIILSDCFMTDMTDALSDHVHALAGPGFRLYYEQQLLHEINTRYRTPQANLEISPQEMVRLLTDYLPEPNFVNAEQFSNYPIYLCWRVKDEGIIAHVNHYHPWVIHGRGLRGPVQLSLDPIDGYFLSRNVIDTRAIALAPNAMLSFDLGNNPLCLPADNNRFNPKKIAQWVRPYLTPVHEHYFRNSLFYKKDGTATSSDWREMAHKAEKIVKEIITDAKA